MRYTILFLALTWLVGCGAEPQPTPAIFGQPTTIKIEQSVRFDDGLVVKFANVPSDGRCSSCTASFNAQVAVQMTMPGKPPVEIILNTNPPFQVQGDPSPYTIKLLDLKPQRRYPPDSINRADYVTTILINR